MDLKYLESYLAIVELGSAAAAARSLYLTDTAIAQRIRALEDEMGVSLLVRRGRTMKPTPQGYAIIQPAKEILKQARNLQTSAMLNTFADELRIGILPTVLSLLVPEVLTEMDQCYPQLKLKIELGFSSDLYHKVENDDLDIAILVEPPFQLNKEMDWQLHHDEPFVVITPPTLENMSAEEALKTQPYIRYHQHSWGGLAADKYLQEQKITPDKRFDLNTLDAIQAVVSHGGGISLIPDWKPIKNKHYPVKKIPLTNTKLTRHIGLLWKTGSPRQHLIDVLKLHLINQSG